MIVRSLVEQRLGRAVCRLINLTEQPIHLHHGQVMANIEHMDKSAIVTHSNIDTQETNQARDLGKDTATIKELGITIDDTNLTPEQKTQLIHLTNTATIVWRQPPSKRQYHDRARASTLHGIVAQSSITSPANFGSVYDPLPHRAIAMSRYLDGDDAEFFRPATANDLKQEPQNRYSF